MDMTNLTKFLIESQPTLSILAVLIIAIVFSFKIWLQYKKEALKDAPQKQAQLDLTIVPDSLDNLSHLLVQNFKILNQFYAENLLQYRTSEIASISIAVLGFVIIISGVLIAIIGNQVTFGSISSAAGIVSEAAAMLFFKQNRLFQDQVQESLKKLVSTQYLMTSISLARELANDPKTEEVRKINAHLRELMNGLHGIATVRP